MFILLKMIKRRVSPETWESGQRLKRRILAALGHDDTQWARKTQIDAWRSFLRALPAASLDALEISPGGQTIWRDIGWRSYTAVQFPEFDITKDRLPRSFDVIIADQVFEHLRDPHGAVRNLRAMLKDDGVFMIATPFLIKIHAYPHDFTRWTPDGLRGFLADAGFDAEIHAWGNRKAAIANFKRWAAYGWGRDLRNEPDFPVNIWAYARKRKPAAS